MMVSKVGGISDVMIDIQDYLDQGELSFEQIADRLDVPIDWVESVAADYEDQQYSYDDSMDGDFDSAMASAGFGTDEDYGYYGEE